MNELDPIDIQILDIMQRDGRIANSELAQRIGLTPPTVLRRVKLLEERGYIKGYTAILDPLKLGLTTSAFILVETEPRADLNAVTAFVGQLDGVQEVHRLLGEWCLLLKVRTHSPQTLEDLVYRVLRQNPSIRRTQTTLSTSAALEGCALPLPQPTSETIDELPER